MERKLTAILSADVKGYSRARIDDRGRLQRGPEQRRGVEALS